jgi:hypothetical protein
MFISPEGEVIGLSAVKFGYREVVQFMVDPEA